MSVGAIHESPEYKKTISERGKGVKNIKYYTKEYYKNPTKDVSAKYEEEFNRNFSQKTSFMEFFDKLHDCDVWWIKVKDDDIVLRIGHEGWGVKGCSDIVFKSAVIKECDFELQDAGEFGWCYHEIYPSVRGYELHVLFYRYGSSEIYELVVEFENAKIKDRSEILFVRVISNEKNRELLFSRLDGLCEKYRFGYEVQQNEPYWKIEGQFEFSLEFSPCPILNYDEWSEMFHYLFDLDFVVEWDYNDDIDFWHYTEAFEYDSFFVHFSIPEKCIFPKPVRENFK